MKDAAGGKRKDGRAESQTRNATEAATSWRRRG